MRVRLLAFLFLLATAAPAIADSTPPVESLEPSTPWQIDYADRECRLTRSFGNGDRAILFRLARGATFDRFDIMLAGQSLPRKKRKVAVSMTLEPQAVTETFEGQNLPVPKRSEYVLRWFDGTAEAITKGPKHQDMLVQTKDGFSVRMKMTDIKPAIAAMKNCHDDLLKGWGIDPDAVTKLQKLPEPIGNPGDWVPLNGELSQERRLVFKLAVGKDGRVLNCIVLESSSNADLDTRSCYNLKTKARFKPAVAANGEEVEAPWISRVRWLPAD